MRYKVEGYSTYSQEEKQFVDRTIQTIDMYERNNY